MHAFFRSCHFPFLLQNQTINTCTRSRDHLLCFIMRAPSRSTRAQI
ncbi:MAG: hypothetical protein HY257_04800 [Chloroflexi bacterium]|nr:hypothetical protein [Chloroflexota bacterium]